MLKKVEQFIDKWDMLSEKDCVIVGVSGGADSVLLLLFLYIKFKKLKKSLEEYLSP